MEKNGKNIFRKSFNVFKNLVFFILVGFLLLYLLLEIFMPLKTARVLGVKASYVKTDSMEPGIKPYDLIFITKPGDLKVGDVITYVGTIMELKMNDDGVYEYVEKKDQIITHRIVRYDEEKQGFITKGDNPKVKEDRNIVKYENVVGKHVLTIPKVGYFVAFVSSPLGLIVIGVNVGVIFTITYILKKDKKKEIDNLEEK